MGRLYPGLLLWFDYVEVVATCRGAVPRQHRLRAEFIFRIERQLRLRLRVVRDWMPMPATLSIWAVALGEWRRFSAEPGFDPVRYEDHPGLLVDCLLYVFCLEVLVMDSPKSPFYDDHRALRSDLMAPHVDHLDVWECVEHELHEHWQSRQSDYDFVMA